MEKQPKVFDYFNRPDPNESAIKKFDQGKTQQQFANEVNINEIMAKAKRGIMPEFKQSQPVYADVSGEEYDFQVAQNIIVQANQMFLELPEKIRERFNNDPAKLLDFVNNPDNKAEAEVLGLLPKKTTNPLDVSGLSDTNGGTQGGEGGETPPSPANSTGNAEEK